jgi:hypothetical protein
MPFGNFSELPRGKPTRHPAEESFLFDENPSVFKLSSKIEASLGELNPKEIKFSFIILV